MTKQEQARWDEVREKTAKRMMVYWIGVVAEEERDRLYADLLEVAGHILTDIPELAVLHPEQELPEEALCGDEPCQPYCHEMEQKNMLAQGWKRVI